jgi:hypothetical protein
MKSDSRQSAVSRLHEPSSRDSGLLAGYREMANDQEHETEALEWCEGLIGDAIPEQG